MVVRLYEQEELPAIRLFVIWRASLNGLAVNTTLDNRGEQWVRGGKAADTIINQDDQHKTWRTARNHQHRRRYPSLKCQGPDGRRTLNPPPSTKWPASYRLRDGGTPPIYAGDQRIREAHNTRLEGVKC